MAKGETGSCRKLCSHSQQGPWCRLSKALPLTKINPKGNLPCNGFHHEILSSYQMVVHSSTKFKSSPVPSPPPAPVGSRCLLKQVGGTEGWFLSPGIGWLVKGKVLGLMRHPWVSGCGNIQWMQLCWFSCPGSYSSSKSSGWIDGTLPTRLQLHLLPSIQAATVMSLNSRGASPATHSQQSGRKCLPLRDPQRVWGQSRSVRREPKGASWWGVGRAIMVQILTNGQMFYSPT